MKLKLKLKLKIKLATLNKILNHNKIKIIEKWKSKDQRYSEN